VADRLIVCAAGAIMGIVEFKANRLKFTYDDDWEGPVAFPLSTSLPVAGGAYEHGSVYPFLANLLPDNENTLAAWGKEFHSSTHPFALLRHKGKDCPGAIQLVPEAEVEPLLSGQTDHFEPLSSSEIASRLGEIKAAASSGHRTTRSGQFSLAGAQPKLSLTRYEGSWGESHGRIPTTHIIKPYVDDDGLELNEHFCLSLASSIGLPAARTWIETFDDVAALVVERYDRDPRKVPTARIHQEDLCQALGIAPSAKYQNEGGPSAAECMTAIVENSDRPGEDSAHFVDALLLQFILAATDAHAKNYSLLLPDATSVRSTPLYDVASSLPHLDLASRRVKFAMKIGEHYSVLDVHRGDWEKQSRAMRVSFPRLRERLIELVQLIPAAAHTVLSQCQDQGLTHAVLPKLTNMLSDRCQKLEREYG
jgi:serine/threonine-protein kinase HipA